MGQVYNYRHGSAFRTELDKFVYNCYSGTYNYHKQLADKKKLEKFHWDWTLLLIAVLITLADALYFFALKQPDAMLGVISIIRRSSIIVSFVLGAFIFKEKKLKRKSLALVLMLGGVILTMFGTL